MSSPWKRPSGMAMLAAFALAIAALLDLFLAGGSVLLYVAGVALMAALAWFSTDTWRRPRGSQRQ